MASVSSPIRKFIKPLLYKIFGPIAYQQFQLYGKLRDIKKRLVEEPEMELLPQFLKSDSVAIDIGANFAYYTVRMAQICQTGKVLAFEPIPATHDICKKIIQHYQLNNVDLYQKGVGERTEKIEFDVPLQELGTHSAGQAHIKGRNNNLENKENFHPFFNHESFLCEVVSIDDFFPSLHKCDFIKIDIEGAELFAMKGMKNFLLKHKPVILMEICGFFLKGFGISEQDLTSFMRSIGYDFYSYNKKTKKLSLQKSSPFPDQNFILLPKEKISRFEQLLHKE